MEIRGFCMSFGEFVAVLRSEQGAQLTGVMMTNGRWRRGKAAEQGAAFRASLFAMKSHGLVLFRAQEVAVMKRIRRIWPFEALFEPSPLEEAQAKTSTPGSTSLGSHDSRSNDSDEKSLQSESLASSQSGSSGQRRSA